MINVEINKFDSKIEFFTMKVNDLTYTFSNFGASIYSLFDNDNPLILTIKDKEKFLKSPQFFGKTLGQVAGRLNSDLKIDDKKFHLVNNYNNICLHGGELNSLSFKVWKYDIKEYKNKVDVKFMISPRKGENGFDGKVKIFVIYSLYKNKLGFKITFKANIKEDSLLNLSNHIYWNLSKELTVNDYKIKFFAPSIGKVNDDLLIIGKEMTPDYLIFDRKTKLKSALDKIKKTKIGTIDHTFIFDVDNIFNSVLLENEKYKLIMKTDYPAMNVYVDSSLTNVEFINHEDLKERRGIALEPQLFNYDLETLYYKKNQKYNHYIEYIIKRK